MMEKIYHKVISAGAAGIVCGVLSILCGITLGVVMIVSGGRLLSSKKDMDV